MFLLLLLRALVVSHAQQRYRKRAPESAEEEEMAQNLFSALCALLLTQENRKRFHATEGVQLMIILIKYAARRRAESRLTAVGQEESVLSRRRIPCTGLLYGWGWRK